MSTFGNYTALPVKKLSYCSQVEVSLHNPCERQSSVRRMQIALTVHVSNEIFGKIHQRMLEGVYGP